MWLKWTQLFLSVWCHSLIKPFLDFLLTWEEMWNSIFNPQNWWISSWEGNFTFISFQVISWGRGHFGLTVGLHCSCIALRQLSLGEDTSSLLPQHFLTKREFLQTAPTTVCLPLSMFQTVTSQGKEMLMFLCYYTDTQTHTEKCMYVLPNHG